MSDENNNEVDTSCCASCGIAEIDDIKLVPCDDCDLARYCSDECRNNHKSEHEEACKKRAAELRDELLFKQPECCYLEDCPICNVPLPIDPTKSRMMSCCSKIICGGCFYANKAREIRGRLAQSCPFCREPAPKTKEIEKRLMKRVEANDPDAMVQVGKKQYSKGHYRSAFEYYTKAAELGDTDAHYQLSSMYHEELGVEKDEGKKIHLLEAAAIDGHPYARYNLGCHEYSHGNIERAVKHWIISAAQGEDESIKSLLLEFRKGHVNKEDLDVALRAHKAAADATKSPQRAEAEKVEYVV